MTPAQRLALSRQAIVDAIEGREPESKHAKQVPGTARPARTSGPAPWWTEAVRSWWDHHPAHVAYEFARPAIASFTRANPWRVLGVAVLAGAAAVFLRPWRLLSLSTLLIGLLRGSQLPRMMFSLLGAANRRFTR